MYLESLTLHNFKNYGKLSIFFKGKITCFMGNNGSGKTNLLDSIYYLSLGKSAFNPLDTQNITHSQSFFSIAGEFELQDEKMKVQCSLKRGEKKSLKLNRVEYSRLSQHVGKIPLVLIAPDDIDLVREHSEARRKFVDNLLSQVDSKYLDNLIEYTRILRHRNALLRRLNEERKHDVTLFEVYDEKLISLAKSIFKTRSAFVRHFKPYFNTHYKDIAEHSETVSISYRSSLKDPAFPKIFSENISKDIALQRTELGIHRDDFIFKINSYPLKKFGSQGQQKSFLIALKLAQYDFLKEEKGFNPLLLMDDIFDKLDDHRITRLMQLVHDGDFGQIFITDARETRTRDIFKKAKIKAGFLCIRNNQVNPC